jgi:simple sugar transport system ATP-binding protein
MVYYMTGQEIGVEPFIYEPISDIPTLKVENLSQRGSFEDISFEMFTGEILGITGQLGSGRTELAEVLFGIGKPTSGRLLLHGVEAKFKNIREAMEKRIAYVPEDRLSEGLFMERDLVDNINAPTIDRKKDRTGLVNIKKMMAEAVKRIQDLSINAKSINQLANTFSGGNQQRIVIAKWLASDPEILILNGPTVGVDVKSKNDIHCILRDLAHEGLCIILISNDIGELLTTTNRILVMNNGQLVYESKTEDADEETLNEKILMGSIEEEIA